MEMLKSVPFAFQQLLQSFLTISALSDKRHIPFIEEMIAKQESEDPYLGDSPELTMILKQLLKAIKRQEEI